MKILVTGANGQLGNELRLIAENSKHNFLFTDLPELDITNEKMVNEFFQTNKPDACINCAAYTAVDKAETDKELAFKINAEAPRILANACSELNIPFVQVSTDFVFDGNKSQPYKEADITNPLGVYGESKLQGEAEAIKSNNKTFVVRTAWLYSTFGNNFVKTMIRLGNERPELNVVFDQIGTPTYAGDLAAALVTMLERSNGNDYGIYHYSNEGACSWYDFTCSIFEMKNINTPVYPIEAKQYPTPAQRPHFSVLNKSKIKNTFNITIPHWRVSLKKCIEQL